MRLADVAGSNLTVELEALTHERDLTRDLQERLAQVGFLDPPADGKFGPVSRWALREFKRLSKTDPLGSLDPATAHALVSDAALNILPLNPGNDLAGRIAAYMI